MRAGLWRGRKAKVRQVHTWRHGGAGSANWCSRTPASTTWLEGRGEKLYPIAMIDDATSRLFARLCATIRPRRTCRCCGVIWRFGRPLTFYTDKAGLFQAAGKRKRDEPGVDKDPAYMPPTQIGRALRELGITWIPAHSPQAKGRASKEIC